MKFLSYFFNKKKDTGQDQTKLIEILYEKISHNQQQLTKYINKFLQNEEKWKLINYLVKNINSTLEIEDLLTLICSQVVKLVGSDTCCIYLYDEENNKLVFKHGDCSLSSAQSFYMQDFIANKNIFVDKFINSNLNICSSSIKNYLNESLDKAYQITPIFNNSNFFGIIFLYKNGEGINAEESNILQIIAENVSMALKNAELYQKLKQSNSNKIEFIASLSHEFKTPLNTIIGFSEILQGNGDVNSSQINKYAENIFNCSKHLLRLIEDIQDASIAESGNINLYYENFNAKNLIQESISQLEGLINKKNIQLNAQLIDTVIHADTKRFRQVIYNLFSNAIKFSDMNGKIKVISYLEEDCFHFEINNFGRIIDPKEKNKLFELFYQGNPSTKNNYEGAGIGLALCKKIINLHNGHIDYSSDATSGTTFTFSLPASPTIQKAPQEEIQA